jgi:hypothetical protein
MRQSSFPSGVIHSQDLALILLAPARPPSCGNSEALVAASWPTWVSLFGTSAEGQRPSLKGAFVTG